MKKYEYDISISLCKQDVNFARKLKQALTPSLNVFFYEDKQEELIGKIGAEEFSRKFKEQSRVVVILYRDTWGESYYTEIEKNAIIDRTAIKNEGYNFIFLIPLEKAQSPSWYPSTRIYANPFNFSIEDLARFIEFKVTELGGVVNPVTFQENLTNFNERLEKKCERTHFLTLPQSIKPCMEELKILTELFNEKVELSRKELLPVSVSSKTFLNFKEYGELGLGNHFFRMNIQIYTHPSKGVLSSQFYLITCRIFSRIFIPGEQDKIEKVKEIMYRFNSNNEYNQGWSVQEKLDELQDEKFMQYVFRDAMHQYYYNLRNIINSEQLIENWFTDLYKMIEREYDIILNE